MSMPHGSPFASFQPHGMVRSCGVDSVVGIEAAPLADSRMSASAGRYIWGGDVPRGNGGWVEAGGKPP